MYKLFGRERVKVWQSMNILTKEYIICIAPVPSTPFAPHDDDTDNYNYIHSGVE